MTDPVSTDPDDSRQALLRQLPSVDVLAEAVRAASESPAPHQWLVHACRAVVRKLRDRLLAGQSIDAAELQTQTLVRSVHDELRQICRIPLRGVINATGILLHTGLGRSPLAPSVVDHVAEVAGHYAPVEIDPDTGQRNKRADLIRPLLVRLTGCESATVVNNNAAATLISLAAVAAGRQVIVSRGELVEIGGSYRLPEVMRAAGVELCEVGTTNRTRPADYADAITDRTAALLKVHTSNFRVVGFTESVGIEELAELGRQRGLTVIDDIGSGALHPMDAFGLADEPWARHSIEAGADLVLFSGDKLLNGPQAGVILGRAAWIDKIEKHPLFRAMRVDKITLTALARTLVIHGDRQAVERELPIYRMLATPLKILRQRSEQMIERLRQAAPNVEAEIIDSQAYLGGGSLPTQAIPSIAVRLTGSQRSADDLASALRRAEPPVIGRIHHDALLFDLRTVMTDQLDALADAIAGVMNQT